jgi:serine phosphatase RsbU (regulator of sigma subunit)
LIENGIVKDQGGNLWFIGDKSIFKHAIHNEMKNTVPPIIVYKGVHIGDKFYKPTDTIINLKYGKYPMVFDFVCVSLTDPEKVEYQYMLEGQDPKWISGSGSADQVNMGGVSSGTFRFKVIAKNEDGYSSAEEILVTINIDVPIWQKWWFIFICLVVVTLTIIAMFRYRTQQLIKNKKELEQKIHEQTIEIRSEKEHVTKINKELSVVYKDLKDSINYAKNIQFSILPNFDDLKTRLGIYTYLNPKDVVGGDFYGFYDLPNKNQIVFLADCTGHGVPGGFLTVIAKALLDKIVLQMKITDCNEIIQNLNIEFRLFFGSESHKQNIKFEGLVISVCYIDYQQRKIKICAAGTSVYYTNGDNEVVRFRGNRDSVGYEEKLSTIDTLELPLEHGSRVYMFSDGVQDQFGGPLFKRYSTKKLLASVDKSKHLPIEEQGEKIISEWMEWKGAQPQIDDVAFITFQVI